MILYRIAREKYARDMSGAGGLLTAARWHDHAPVIYTSQTSSTCILEKLVHLEPSEIHNDLVMISLHVPDDILIEILEAKQLPANWNTFPAPSILKRIGTAWLKSMSAALLQIPSAIDPIAKNVLINPRHEDAAGISIENIVPFTFDGLLLKRG